MHSVAEGSITIAIKQLLLILIPIKLIKAYNGKYNKNWSDSTIFKNLFLKKCVFWSRDWENVHSKSIRTKNI